MTWHATSEQLARYADGAVDAATSASVEAHLLTCAVCQSAVASSVDLARLDAVWAGVVDRVDEPRAGLVERALRRLGVAPHTARLLAATTSLRLSWLAALVAVLGFALAAAHSSPDGVRLFLVVAPLLPVAGVAAAFGPTADPTYELAVSAPYSAARLLLLRATAVLTATVVVAGLSAALLPSLGWTAAAWLLPALGLTGIVLVLSTHFDVVAAASLVGTFWLSLTVYGLRATERLVVEVNPAAQLCWLAVALLTGIALHRNRDSFDQGRA